MKLIISGGSGYVATELIRQSLSLPQITSLVVLTRRPITAPDHANAGKLKQVLIEDYARYPENIRKELSGANACIWLAFPRDLSALHIRSSYPGRTVAITPTKARSYDFEKVRHVCQTCALAGLQAVAESSPSKPLRFVYMSGSVAERDQTKQASLWGADYLLMRVMPRILARPSYWLTETSQGETETKILEFAEKHPGEVEAQIAKPGLITSYNTVVRSAASILLKGLGAVTSYVQSVSVEEISAAMLSQVVGGFEKDTLSNSELVEIGRKALSA
ncbi:hypothetical protein S40285_05115 [Stachybotrys chlorohalonatus IBT 40285]|uniref:NAD(P)-binding domain-containing protein n=1 Tax=Stachybotrys chlorohalonatus (strain IBT 40285) TaxID=1283841 RepID=A0A084QQK4_STAC4|nr:hypothetical protein S40285_05115 [Stachybotrys chlorohalonata IBT 40285]